MIEVEIRAGDWAEQARALKDDGWLLMDLCGLDRLHLGFEDRFGVVVQLLQRDRGERQTLHIAAEGDPPTTASVSDVWPTANFMEREAFDLFGIVFEGHPALTRILLPDEWEGHPLRKDYGVGKVPVEFKTQSLLQIQGPGQGTNTAAADLAVDRLGQPEEAVDR